MSRPLALSLCCLVLAAACRAAPAATASGTPQATETPGSTTLPGGISKETLKVTVADAKYGSITASAVTGAECSGLLRVGAGHFGEQPPSLLPVATADGTGVAHWTYSAPRVPNGTATFSVTCTTPSVSGTATGSFDIAFDPMKASSFKVHVTTDAPPLAQFSPDPSLVPLREASLTKMRATLAAEWKSATRGLGGLEVTDTSADITLYLVAARGTSVHRSYPDGSQDAIVYVSDATTGRQSVENVIATALHELGHIWCCFGDGTSEGHWLTNERQPGLYGVDKYGLMTDPVTCVQFGSILSCPNRFSDREMTALGFASFPPPTIDPCVSQALSLTSRLDALNKQLAQQQASLASLRQQLDTLSARYPGNSMPPSVIVQYNALVDQYNGLLAQNRGTVDQYNALVTQANNLPCDAS